MGFGSALAYYMIGFAVISMFIVIAVVQQDNLSDLTEAFTHDAQSFSQKAESNINITKVFNYSDDVFVYVKNTGQQQLDVNSTFLFVNDKFIALNHTNHYLYAPHDISNPGLWGPGETLVFNVTDTSPTCGTSVKVSDEYGSFDTKSIACNSICRAESTYLNIPAGESSEFHKLNKSITNLRKAFLIVDSAGIGAVSNARDHLVTGYIYNTTDLLFERGAPTPTVAEVSYALIECFNTDLWVQRGETTLGANVQSENFTVNATDNSSMVLVSMRSDHAANTHEDSYATAELYNPSTVMVRRYDEGGGVTAVARWEVVDFLADSGVQVQSGEVDLASTLQTVDVHLPFHVNHSNSFVYCSWDVDVGGLQQSAVACALPNGTTLSVSRHQASAFINRVKYYVVEFPKNTINVQHGSVLGFDPPNIGDSPFHVNVTINEVSPSNSISITTNTVQGSGGSLPRGNWVERIRDPTTLQLTLWRTGGAADTSNQLWQVIEFIEDTSPPETLGVD